MAEGENLWEESLLAYITLILKEGKDPMAPESYRSISLLNTDINIFAKIIAGRVKPLMPRWIHSDQLGFVTGREGKDNRLKSLFLIHKMRERGGPAVLLRVDAKKAFNSGLGLHVGNPKSPRCWRKDDVMGSHIY